MGIYKQEYRIITDATIYNATRIVSVTVIPLIQMPWSVSWTTY